MLQSYESRARNSEWHGKVIFEFTEIVNDRKFWRGAAHQIGRIIFLFSQKLHVQILKYLHNNLMYIASSHYYENSRMLNLSANNFG